MAVKRKPTRRRPKRRHKDHAIHELKELLIKQHEKELEKINQNELKLKEIMASLKDLQDKADASLAKATALQASIDTVQGAIGTAVAAFEKAIADLQAIIDAGGAPAGLQAIADTLDQTNAALDAAKTDIESTPTA